MNLKSYLIALAVALVLAAWMLSGQLGTDGSAAQTAPASRDVAVMDVQVARFEASRVQRYLENQGETRADQDVDLRAETDGQVAEVLIEEGSTVAAGDTLVRLAMGDRDARREEARARVAQREADFEAAQRLQGNGFQSDIAVQEARAALHSARARLAEIEKEIRDTRIASPIDGEVESRPVQVGDYLRAGETVARLVDTDPLIAVAHVAQQDIRKVQTGREAQISLATGDELSGEITYISNAAESGSRTFRVEVRAPNPDRLPAGVSATIRIPLDPVRAHFLSPAWLSLEDTGEVGVKTVDDRNRVVFRPVDIVRAERDGVWVSGLPDRIRLITVGQGFVRAGETVNPVEAEGSPGLATEPSGGAGMPTVSGG